jgi:hypothetical protein
MAQHNYSARNGKLHRLAWFFVVIFPFLSGALCFFLKILRFSHITGKNIRFSKHTRWKGTEILVFFVSTHRNLWHLILFGWAMEIPGWNLFVFSWLKFSIKRSWQSAHAHTELSRQVSRRFIKKIEKKKLWFDSRIFFCVFSAVFSCLLKHIIVKNCFAEFIWYFCLCVCLTSAELFSLIFFQLKRASRRLESPSQRTHIF